MDIYRSPISDDFWGTIILVHIALGANVWILTSAGLGGRQPLWVVPQSSILVTTNVVEDNPIQSIPVRVFNTGIRPFEPTPAI